MCGGTYNELGVLNQRAVLDAVLDGTHRVVQRGVIVFVIGGLRDRFDLSVVTTIRCDGKGT